MLYVGDELDARPLDIGSQVLANGNARAPLAEPAQGREGVGQRILPAAASAIEAAKGVLAAAPGRVAATPCAAR